MRAGTLDWTDIKKIIRKNIRYTVEFNVVIPDNYDRHIEDLTGLVV